jgi:hypothetical protein
MMKIAQTLQCRIVIRIVADVPETKLMKSVSYADKEVCINVHI